MAQLPPDGQYLIQQIDGEVVLFERDTEREYCYASLLMMEMLSPKHS